MVRANFDRVRNAERASPDLRFRDVLVRPMKAAGVWTALVIASSLVVYVVLDGGGEAFLANGVLSVLWCWLAIPFGALIVGVWAFIDAARALKASSFEAFMSVAAAALLSAFAVVILGLATAAMMEALLA